MRIGAGGFSPLAFASLRLGARRAEELEPVREPASEKRDLLRLGELLGNLRASVLEGRERLQGARGTGTSGVLRVRSASDLGLDTSVRAAALRSSEEINTTATSFGARGPAWEGLSVPNATVDGLYDGSNGDQTLTFKVTRSGIVGTTAVRVDVFDESGTRLDRLNFAAGYDTGTPLALSNGLTLALGAGLAVIDDTFEVAVSASTGTAFDPGRAFDGRRNFDPELEDGFAIVDGSFLLQGARIDVFAADSLNDVLARIDAAGLGLTAGFDAAGERVVFTHDTPGAAGTLEVGDDTSGFLAAMKLDGAALEAGRDSDLDRPLAELGRAGLAAGTLTVNGVTRALDPAQDTLREVLAWMDGLGLDARLDEERGELLLTSRRALELDDGASGFFAAFGLDEGRHAAPHQARGFARDGEVRDGLARLASAWNALLEGQFEGTAARQAERIRKALESGVRAHFERASGESDGSRLDARLGLEFSFAAGETGLELEAGELDAALRGSDDRLAEFLLGNEQQGGLLAALESALRPGVAALGAILESRGFARLDLEA